MGSTCVTDPHVAQRMGLPKVEQWFYGIGSLDEAISSADASCAIYSFDADSGKGSKLYHASPTREVAAPSCDTRHRRD